MVYDYPKSVVVAFGHSDRGYEAVVALAVFEDAVRLYLDKDLPDPKGLLKGSGTKVRSLTISNASEFDGPDIKALLKAALGKAGTPSSSSGAGRILIKTGSKKRTRVRGKRT